MNRLDADTSPIPRGELSITPNLITKRQITALRKDAKSLYSAGVFVAGGLRRGRGANAGKTKTKKNRMMRTETDDSARVCDVCGLFDDAERAPENAGDREARECLFDLMSDLRALLQKDLGVGLSEGMELQYLRYPGCGAAAGSGKDDDGDGDGSEGRRGFYGRHFDSGGDDNMTRRRKISLLLYLNEDGWCAERDGGMLRAYLPHHRSTKRMKTGSSNIDGAMDTKEGSSAAPVQDVIPEGGKLVLFDSKLVEHEVLPTNRERIAVVGWFLSDDADTRNRKNGGERRGIGDKKLAHHPKGDSNEQMRKKKKKKRRRGR